MLCISAAYAVMRCLSVRLSVTFVDSVKTSNQYLQNISPSGSHTILVFPHQTSRQHSDGTSLTGASNAGGVGRNPDSEPISGFIACCQRCDRLGVINTVLPNRGIAGSKRRSLLMAGDDDEMFVTRSFNVTPKTTEQHLIVLSDKSNLRN